MGKRKKAAKKPGGKKNEPLSTNFDCLFCNHPNAVSVTIDKKAGVGQLSCKTCNQQFQCAVNYLSAAVDVYSDWVDACDAVAKEAEGGRDLGPDGYTMSRTPARPKARDQEDEDDDLIDDRDDDGYGGDGIVADDEDY